MRTSPVMASGFGSSMSFRSDGATSARRPFLRTASRDEGHWIERMRGVGSAVGVEGVVCIAVVSYDDCLVAVSAGSLHCLRDALVESLDSLLDGGVDSGVTHHVAVGEIDHDEVIFLGIDRLDELFGHLGSAHLGLEVVGRHLWRGNEYAVLAAEGRTTA